MRIGTWNMAGRWDDRHERLLDEQDCDVWLLTEVHQRAGLVGYECNRTAGTMMAGRAWAAVLSRSALETTPDPHPASAAARIDGIVYCSSILPWRSCGSDAPWVGADHAARAQHAVATLMASLPDEDLVWGGDWNHSLTGAEIAGSKAGREAVLAGVSDRGLRVPTAGLPSHLDDCLSIDHIAVPAAWEVGARHVTALVDGARLSDHDAYVVDVSAVIAGR